MYLENNDIITLDNKKEYIVLDSVIIDNNNFVFLVEKDNMENQVIAMASMDNDRLRIDEIDLDDKENKEILLKIFEEISVDQYKKLKEWSNKNED